MVIRPIETKDIKDLLRLIHALADFEKMSNQVKNTEEALYQHIFIKQEVHALMVEVDQKIVGFALYFYTYSTFVGKQGLYLEDIYIEEGYRSLGIGTKLFKALAEIARSQDLERFEWTCLNWNVDALEFYKRLGAVQMKDWITHRLTKDAMEKLILL